MNSKVHKVVLVILVTLLTMFSSAIIYAHVIEVPEDIRIGLYYDKTSVATLKLSSPGGIEVGVMINGEFKCIDEVEENKEVSITKGMTTGSVTVSGIGEIGSAEEYPYFKSLEKNDICLMNINGRLYRGNVEIRRFSDSDMTVINHLSMQEYLYSVVPCEMGVRTFDHEDTPIEALKAQAIIARTYAARNYNKRSEYGFNLCSTTDDQVYKGYWYETIEKEKKVQYFVEKEASNAVVDETEGRVAVYNGKLIEGFYFSTSGGFTENSENVWVTAYDYLKAVPDIYEPVVPNNTTWEVRYTADEIKELLKDKKINIGEIIDIKITKTSDVGRVLELQIIGTEGTKTLTKLAARTYLKLKSQWFTVNDEAPKVKEVDVDEWPINNNVKDDDEKTNEKSEVVENEKDLVNDDWWMKENSETKKEEYIVIEPDYSNDEENYIKVENKKEMKPLLKKIVDTILKDKVSEINVEYKSALNKNIFVFLGRGNGHGVGMSQNGAIGMARAGFSCEEIIAWYYSGAEVTD